MFIFLNIIHLITGGALGADGGAMGADGGALRAGAMAATPEECETLLEEVRVELEVVTDPVTG